MDQMQIAIDVMREALFITVLIGSPILLVGLVVGVFVSVIQAATQIQEQTLSFVPKILAVLLILFVLSPWILTVMMDYTTRMFTDMATFKGFYHR